MKNLFGDGDELNKDAEEHEGFSLGVYDRSKHMVVSASDGVVDVVT